MGRISSSQSSSILNLNFRGTHSPSRSRYTEIITLKPVAIDFKYTASLAFINILSYYPFLKLRIDSITGC